MRRLGALESGFLAWSQMREVRVVRTGDLRAPLHLSEQQERELLSRMARSGLIARVRRGVYLVPERLPLGGSWSPDAGLALATLLEDEPYQITGPAAFQRYGYIDQVPTTLHVYNTRYSGERSIGAVRLSMIRVGPARLGATAEVSVPSGSTLVYSSRARTLVDAIYDWSRFDTLPRAYEWVRGELRAGMKPAELVRIAVEFGNQGTLRRLGALLEAEGASGSSLARLRRAIESSKSVIAAVPRVPRRGELLERWGVIVNG